MSIDNAPTPDLEARALAVLASPAVAMKRAPSSGAWPLGAPEPRDLAALYAATDGLELADGTCILRRADIAVTTSWLKQERSLDDWPDELIVIGERRDLVIVRDLDASGARAGGGVLEAASDGLSTFKRVALNVVGYLEQRLAPGSDPDPPPEIASRDAASAKDAAALAAAIARPFYPGAELALAHAALTLGSLRAASGDEAGAMRAFETSVAARARSVRRGAEASETRAAWRACAEAANRAGSESLRAACAARAV